MSKYTKLDSSTFDDFADELMNFSALVWDKEAKTQTDAQRDKTRYEMRAKMRSLYKKLDELTPLVLSDVMQHCLQNIRRQLDTEPKKTEIGNKDQQRAAASYWYCSISPKIPKPMWAQFSIANRITDVAMTQVSL